MAINVAAFLDSLSLMVSGMVGIFVVMMIIYGLIIGLSAAFSKKKKKS